jgi:hypothetical protein
MTRTVWSYAAKEFTWEPTVLGGIVTLTLEQLHEKHGNNVKIPFQLSPISEKVY